MRDRERERESLLQAASLDTVYSKSRAKNGLGPGPMLCKPSSTVLPKPHAAELDPGRHSNKGV